MRVDFVEAPGALFVGVLKKAFQIGAVGIWSRTQEQEGDAVSVDASQARLRVVRLDVARRPERRVDRQEDSDA